MDENHKSASQIFDELYTEHVLKHSDPDSFCTIEQLEKDETKALTIRMMQEYNHQFSKIYLCDINRKIVSIRIKNTIIILLIALNMGLFSVIMYLCFG